MICPHCHTVNREDRASCYHCSADLALLRAIVAKSRAFYQQGLEHAERGRPERAIASLRDALDLDASFARGWVVLGTLLAKDERFAEAEEAWLRAIACDPECARAHEYLGRAARAREVLPALVRLRRLCLGLAVALGALGAFELARLAASRPATAVLEKLVGPGDAPARLLVIVFLLLPLVVAAAGRLAGDESAPLRRWARLFRDEP